MNILDLIAPQANAAAASATNTALDTAAARPFSVELSIAPDTQRFIIIMLVGIAIRAALLRR